MMSQQTVPTLDFATVMASSVHDMKNSLSAVLAGLDGLQQETQLSAGNNRQVDGLRHQSRRLNCQLMQMLSIYKLQQDLYSPNIQQWPVDEFLEDVASEHRGLLAAQGISICDHTEPELSGFFDRELVVGVLDNALNNAVRYSRSRLEISARYWVHEQGEGVELSLRDDGPGYPEAMCVRSGQTAAALQFQQGRTGLGLYFCSLVADLHRNKGVHGRIICDNEGIDGGGRFALLLP
ncbi:MAG: sensor histidine kinase [Oceanococcus sp.]